MSSISGRLPRVLYGGDYNPEQWREETWLEDARLMQEASVNLVSLGIFAWSRLEPSPGEYRFEWLDRVMGILHAHGVFVDLGTATASPPPWLARLHPESLPVTADGIRLSPGSRQAYCPSSPAYRQAATALVGRLAKRYRDHPALLMWHVNNEYGCHLAECYCEQSARAFREWLRRRHGTVEALNQAWGTSFWSQEYGDWEEVQPPRSTPAWPNPGQRLDFQRFCSDELLACFELERAVLAELTPEVPVTTNFMGFFAPVDYHKWAARQDVVSQDSYPDPADPDAPAQAAVSYDLIRSLGGGRPWLLMEQSPTLVDWRPHNVLKRPGQMRLWSYQALARGADGVLFFQWRAQRFGVHKHHGAMLPHAGTESRAWREVRQLGAELARLEPVLGTRVPASTAILFDWESWWALEHEPAKPSADLRLIEQVHSYYRPLYDANVTVDVVGPGADLERYRLLLVPNLYLAREGVAGALERFVAGGGVLAMSFFSGIVDQRGHVQPGGYGAPFRRLLGLRIEECEAYLPGQANAITFPDGSSHRCALWSDLIELEGAEAVASYQEDFYAGRPALTRHRFGRGVSYYRGTRPEPVCMALLLRQLCHEAGVPAVLDAPRGVEAVRRRDAGRSLLFVLNHRPEPVEVRLAGPAQDLLTGAASSGALALEPFGVAVLAEE